jgi:Acetyltransferase (GNAT) domain
MAAQFQIVDPLEIPNWDEIVLTFPEAGIFHSVEWARVLVESYGFKPVYCVAYDQGKPIAIIPIMEVRDLLGRKKGISLPFSDFCQPLFREQSAFLKVFKFAQETGLKNKWQSLSLRGNSPFSPDSKIATFYFRHTLKLSNDTNGLFKNFRENTRRNIKKALKENVTVTFENSIGAVREFYRLNCLTRKRHGLPPQPFFFFRALHKNILLNRQGNIALAHCKNKIIGAFVFLQFGETAFYKYGASDEHYNNSRANYLLMWEAIQKYAQAGSGLFCFGRTESRHEGLLQFKNGWGANQLTINNYLYNFRKKDFVEEDLRTSGFHTIIFKRMPLIMLRAVGTIFYKYNS